MKISMCKALLSLLCNIKKEALYASVLVGLFSFCFKDFKVVTDTEQYTCVLQAP